jgi:hypothetical protein
MNKAKAKIEFEIDLREIYKEDSDELLFYYDEYPCQYVPEEEAFFSIVMEDWVQKGTKESDILYGLLYKYCEEVLYKRFEEWFNNKQNEYLLSTELEYTYE